MRQRMGFVIAGLLVLAGGGLQLAASLQRWGRPRGVDDPIESHEFDYLVPQSPWTPIRDAAELHGSGLLAIAGALLIGAVALGGRARLIAGLVAAALVGLLGAHALLSGLQGSPSPLEAVAVGPASFLAPVALLVVAALQLRAAPLLALGSASLVLGATIAGQLLSAFTIAPLIAGHTSYDMTPWTETIMAAFTLLGGAVMLAGRISTRP